MNHNISFDNLPIVLEKLVLLGKIDSELNNLPKKLKVLYL